MDQSSVLVHPDAARRQIEADSERRPPVYAPRPSAGPGEVGEGINGETGVESPDGAPAADPPAPAEPADLARSFHGVVDIDPTRLGGNAGAISQEVVQRLTSILGSDVRVTLEIQARVPDGIPEKIVHDVLENCNTLRFREYGFSE
jgi:hypothetical protein